MVLGKCLEELGVHGVMRVACGIGSGGGINKEVNLS
ncbi:hypothetical protein [Staphylococcus hominis]